MSHTRIRIWGAFGIVLILFSIAFAGLPLLPNNSLDVMRITVRQRALEERIVKDVMSLSYQPTDKVVAISELQNTLPIWEQVQVGLLNGDPSLGISTRIPNDIKSLLLQAQPDYMSMDVALRKILTHPSPVDPVQLAIVLQHEQGYYLTMAQVEMISEGDIQTVASGYFYVGLGISIGLMIIWIVFFRGMLRMEKEKTKTEDKK